MKSLSIALICVCLLTASTPAWSGGKAPAWTTDGPYVDGQSIAIELPMQVLATRLYVDVELGGKPRRFLFDTGSPSMISTELAAELGLEAVDTRQGRDSHGAIVETRVVQSDLGLGGTLVRKVPIFVADFPHTARCLFDGVLGSELLPLCAWQIDLPDSTLRCVSERSDLAHIASAKKLQLTPTGYPHAPILDIQFARDAHSKAMFDTGAAEYLTLSPPDFDGANRSDAVGGTTSGTGSLGGSIGGLAPDLAQTLVELRALAIGELSLGTVVAPLRESPPSLIGAAILEHYVVTLDSRRSVAYFDAYRDGPFVRRSYGLGLNFEDVPQVSLVWEDSPAATAGLRVGQRITAINGAPASNTCDSIRKAMQALSDGDTLELEWEGGAATLARTGKPSR